MTIRMMESHTKSHQRKASRRGSCECWCRRVFLFNYSARNEWLTSQFLAAIEMPAQTSNIFSYCQSRWMKPHRQWHGHTWSARRRLTRDSDCSTDRVFRFFLRSTEQYAFWMEAQRAHWKFSLNCIASFFQRIFRVDFLVFLAPRIVNRTWKKKTDATEYS